MSKKVTILFNEPVPDVYRQKLQGRTDFSYDENKLLESYEWVLYEFNLMREELEKSGYRATMHNIEDNLDLFLQLIRDEKPDVIFNCVEVFYQLSILEMTVAGLYEMLGIPFTGSSAGTLANCQNKRLTKRIVASHGVQTPRDVLFKSIQESYLHDLRYPLIAKPALEDSSNGVDFNGLIYSEEDLRYRVEKIIRELNQPVLVEEYIDGREINVAVFGDNPYEMYKLSEIDFSTLPPDLPRIVSYQAKWEDDHETYHKTVAICPAPVSEEIESRFRDIAIRVCTAMGVRDYTRIDFRLTPDNEIYFLEVNPNPDLSEGTGFMRSAAASGFGPTEILGKIVELALKRGAKKI